MTVTQAGLRSLRYSLIACALTFSCFSQLFALPTDLDPIFGIYSVPFGTQGTGITSIELTPDGSFFFAGYASFSVGGTQSYPTLEKFTPGGQSVTSADEACRSLPPFRGSYSSTALQQDGKLLVAGAEYPPTSSPPFVTKYLIVR